MLKLPTKTLLSILDNARLTYDKKNIRANCPWCNHDEFGVSIQEGHTFNCFRKKRCGVTGNIYTLLRKLDRLDLLPKENMITPEVVLNDTVEDVINYKEPVKPLDEVAPLHLPPFPLPVGYTRIYSNKYLEEDRGWCKEDFIKFEVGETKLLPSLSQFVLFPVRFENTVIGYIGRNTNKHCDKRERYNNSKSNISHTLYYEDRIQPNKPLVITEGIFDCINVHRYVQEEMSVTCSFKANISPQQRNIIKTKNITELIVFYDYDILGKIEKHLLEVYSELNIPMSIAFIESLDRDPGDSSEEEIKKSLQFRIDVLDFFNNFISLL